MRDAFKAEDGCVICGMTRTVYCDDRMACRYRIARQFRHVFGYQHNPLFRPWAWRVVS